MITYIVVFGFIILIMQAKSEERMMNYMDDLNYERMMYEEGERKEIYLEDFDFRQMD